MNESARFLWAKSDRGRTDGLHLPLITHLLDVAACIHAILEREGANLRKLYAEDLGLEIKAVIPWVAALGGLHDLGKASPAFQLQWKHNGREQGRELLQQGGFSWEQSEVQGKAAGHGVVSQILLEDTLVGLGIPKKAAYQIADALGAHHGFRADGEEKRDARARKGSGLWEEARRWLVQQVLCVTTASQHSPPNETQLSGQAFMRLAGLVSFSDWIGSNSRWFKFERQCTDLVALYTEALDCARQALEDIGWPRGEKCFMDFETLFGFSPRPLQVHTQSLLTDQNQPALLLIEDQMGSGKTEAALYASLMLQSQVGHRGFYVALPTQATGNAMFERVERKFLNRLGYSIPPDLQLIHGAALLDKRFEEMRLQIGEEAQPEQSVVAHEWFSHRKQGLLSPHAVGTVDQILLSILNVGHHFVRLWGLGNRVVILDEVHAYELYTSTLIERLLCWLKAMNGSVILLSATLPEQIRQRLIRAWGSEHPAEDQPYPRITKAAEGKSVVMGLETRALDYAIQTAPLDVEELAQKLVELSQGEGAVGCIVNTVSRAQELYKSVQARLAEQSVKPTLKLFHARFPAQQRKEIEEWVIGHLGKDNKALRKSIVIATQTIEQSIDADFDVLVTDLCPIDLLLQRAGRLHRHNDPRAFERNLRGIHTKPILYISGLAEDYSSLDLTRYYWHMVYNRATLLRTWAVLRHRLDSSAMLSLPDDLQGENSLLEKVYGKGKLEGNFGSQFQKDLAEATEKLEEERKQERQLAKDRALVIPERLFEYLPDDDQKTDDEDPQLNKNFRAVTRLGEPSVTVVLLERREGKLHSLQGEQVSLAQQPTFAQAKELLQTAVGLSNREVFDFLAEKPVAGWKESALLRHVRVLELEDKKCVIGKLEVRLDDELGVVYERTQQR